VRVWVCDRCEKREPYESSGGGPEEEYAVGDFEPCVDCDGTATLCMDEALQEPTRRCYEANVAALEMLGKQNTALRKLVASFVDPIEVTASDRVSKVVVCPICKCSEYRCDKACRGKLVRALLKEMGS
jgi:hypothetical protein